jgi:hypothetical protein
MLYHPVTLKLLYEWKLADEKDVPLDLLALLVDNRTSVDYGELHEILYGYKRSKLKKKEKIAGLKSIVKNKFTFKKSLGVEPGLGSRCLLVDLNGVSHGVRKLLRYNRKRKGKDPFPASEIDPPETPNKRREPEPGVNTLKFPKMDERRGRMHSTLGPFVPITFESNTAVCTSDPRSMETIRMRKDIQDPKKLVFFKFHGELKPPIYHFKVSKTRRRNSLKRIPEVLDYDEDSGWEDDGDAETIGTSGEDDEEADESSREWIESGSESVELSRSSKKPSLMFPDVKFKVLVEGDFWLSLPLTERDSFPQECMEAFKMGLDGAADPLSYARAFGRKHMIKPSVTAKHLKTMEQ